MLTQAATPLTREMLAGLFEREMAEIQTGIRSINDRIREAPGEATAEDLRELAKLLERSSEAIVSFTQALQFVGRPAFGQDELLWQ
jgi:hypothetical protein